MKLLRRCAPWFAAFLVPGVLVGTLYALGGASLAGCVIGGVAGGVVGLFGAMVLELVRSQVTPAGQKLDDYVAQWRRDTRERIEHEGTARMHEDIQRDEERVRREGFCCEAGVRALPGPCPVHGKKQDEPPERG